MQHWNHRWVHRLWVGWEYCELLHHSHSHLPSFALLAAEDIRQRLEEGSKRWVLEACILAGVGNRSRDEPVHWELVVPEDQEDNWHQVVKMEHQAAEGSMAAAHH